MEGAPTVYEGFTHSSFTLGASVEGLGSTAAPFSGTWDDVRNNVGDADLIQPGLGFVHSSGAVLDTRGFSLLLRGTTLTSSEDDRNFTDIVANDTVVWAGFLLRKETAGTSPNDFGFLRLRLTSGAPEIQIGDFSSDNRIGLVRDSSQRLEAFSPVVMEIGTTYLLVARITLAPLSVLNSDVVDFFINPVPGDVAPTSPDATLGGLDIPGISRIRLSAGNHVEGASYSLDEFRFGATFGDVAPAAPEPGTAILAAMGIVGLAASRRR